MDIEKLRKEDFKDPFKGEPLISFAIKGEITLNRMAVEHLGLRDGDGFFSIHICRDVKSPADFGIFIDPEGWCLRADVGGRAKFNCIGLAQHVMEATWNRQVSHPVNSVMPSLMTFRIARLPLDDNKNKDVFALLRKTK
jgi:hypothetical protein